MLRTGRDASWRVALVLVLALVAVGGAILAVERLQREATAGRDAELTLITLRLDLAQMQDVPWGASPDEGADPDEVRSELRGMQEKIERALDELGRDGGLPERGAIVTPLNRSNAALWEILELVAQGKADATGEPSGEAAEQMYVADAALQEAARRYRARSAALMSRSRIGSAVVILALFCAFGWFFARVARARSTAEALVAENRRLLALSRDEALTDALTGLGNRRALAADLQAAEAAAPGRPLMLALFDLDGFKQYNDSFGHPAGDSLLARLAERLVATMDGIGSAYRMGGDEFCIIAAVPEHGAQAITALAAAALSDEGEAFSIGCSYGTTVMPRETSDPDEALLLADQRMYEHKASGRLAPGRQSADVLLRLLTERSNELGQHTSDVAALAELTAARLGLSEAETSRIRLAAELHDVGKAAIPDAILDKPGALDDDEWEFIRRHTVIGERILRAAPALSHTADLVRWHHERYDGSGYPDRLAAAAIPLGARIIAVSDAFDAMVTDRPYRAGIPIDEALAELRRCAGSQFDPAVVEAFTAAIAQHLAGTR